jgi:ABC-type nickel/cobalt efflux system permease component RcnA
VLVLGFALWRTVSAPDAARLGAAIEAVAGATFLTLGLWLVSTRRRDARAHGQGHGHEHGHDHGHDHGHAEHGHAGHDDRGGGRPHHDGRDVEAAGGGLAVAERAAPVAADSRSQRLVALGAAGGLLPSPSALAVLLTALFLDRLGYGLALVAAFSFGMAVVLSGVGLAVLAGRDLAARRLPARLHGALHAAPMLGAFAVVLLGGLVLARGLGRLL